MTIMLQCCTACGAAQYPTRAVCRACLSDTLTITKNSGAGTLLAHGRIWHTLDRTIAPELPVTIGTVLLDAGVHVIAFVDEQAVAGSRVRLRTTRNGRGDPVLMAEPAPDSAE